MDASEWANALDWIHQQTATSRFSIPDPIPGDEPASPKQIVYIRSLVQHIDENALQGLTKHQAISVIEQIRIEKKKFSEQKAVEYVAMHARQGRQSSGLAIIAIIIIAVIIAFALLR